jgi:hypothetical protein
MLWPEDWPLEGIMDRMKVGGAAALLLAVGAVAHGAQPSYSYVELAHENISVDVEEGSLHHLDAMAIQASWQVSNHFALMAEARRVKEDDDQFVDHKAFGNFLAGATTFWSIFGVVDSYLTINYDFGVGQGGGELGLRARPISAVELHVALNVDGMPRTRNRRTGAGNLEFGLAIQPTRHLAIGFDHGKTVVGDDIGAIDRIFLRYDFAHEAP